MKYWSLLIAVFSSFVLFSSVTLQHGIVGLTRLNGEGCVCHNFASSATTNIRISGPDSVLAGSTVKYVVKMSGAPGVVGGYNTAARSGVLSIADSSSVIIDNELTHRNPKLFTGDTVSWAFYYTAPNSVGWDTLYCVGLSANRDSIPTSEDKWNFGANFPVKIVSQIPVELTSFSVTNEGRRVTLDWATATETNNKGFEIFRVSGNSETRLGFVSGAGNSVSEKKYKFIDNSVYHGESYYTLKQIDYDGSATYFRSESVTLAAPDIFELHGNYPNPFNPSTKISYSLPVSGEVKIYIYNSAVELISNPVNSIQPAGFHSYEWNAGGKPSGIYYCRVEFRSGERTDSRTIKLALTK